MTVNIGKQEDGDGTISPNNLETTANLTVSFSDLTELSAKARLAEQQADVGEVAYIHWHERYIQGLAIPHSAYYWKPPAWEKLTDLERSCWNQSAYAARAQAYGEINLRELQEERDRLISAIRSSLAALASEDSISAIKYLKESLYL